MSLSKQVEYAFSELDMKANVLSRRLKLKNGDTYKMITVPGKGTLYLKRIVHVDEWERFRGIDYVPIEDQHIFLYLSRLEAEGEALEKEGKIVYALNKFSL